MLQSIKGWHTKAAKMMMEKQGKMETDGIVMIHATSASVTMEGFGKMK